MIHPVTRAEAAAWAALRQALWPQLPATDHALAIERYFWGGGEDVACFVAHSVGTHSVGTHSVGTYNPGAIVGFVELSVRWVAEDGALDRIASLDGWYVHPAWRQQGIGRALVAAAEGWARAQHCHAVAAELPIPDAAGQVLHQSLGFSAPEPLMRYRKFLATHSAPSRAIMTR